MQSKITIWIKSSPMVDANQKSLSYSRGTNVDHPRLWTKDMSRIFNLSLSHIFSGCSRNSRLLNLLLLSQVKLLSNTKKMTSGTSRGAHVYTLFHEFLSHFCTKDVFLLMVYTHFYSLLRYVQFLKPTFKVEIHVRLFRSNCKQMGQLTQIS